MVERNAQDGGAHRHAEAASTGLVDQPGARVHGAQGEVVVGLERLDTDDGSVVLDSEAEAPRRGRPGPHRAPVLLVDEPRAVPAHVHPGKDLGAWVVLVVVRLDRGEVREVPLTDGPQRDVAAAQPEAEQRPGRDQRLVHGVGHPTSIETDAASRTAWSSTARRGSGTASHGSTRTSTRCTSRGSDEDRVDGGPVSPAHQSGQPAGEDPGGVLGGGLVGLPGLVVAPPGEPLLALPAGLGAALHVPLPDLGLGDADPGDGGDGEAALADQQHAPPGRGLDGVREGRRRRPDRRTGRAKGSAATAVAPSAAEPTGTRTTPPRRWRRAGAEVLEPADDAPGRTSTVRASVTRTT